MGPKLKCKIYLYFKYTLHTDLKLILCTIFWYTYSLPVNLSHEARCGIFHLWYLLVLKKLNFSKHFEFLMFIIKMLVCSFH